MAVVDVSIQDRGHWLSPDQRSWVREILDCAMSQIGASVVTEATLSVTLVDRSEISKLHEEFFADPSVTDVITFPGGEPWFGDEHHFGDIAICFPIAAEQGCEAGHSAVREVGFLALHGVLHLLGYNDATDEDRQRMIEIQANVLVECERVLGTAPAK